MLVTPPPPPRSPSNSVSPLASLPLSAVLRTLLITTVSSHPRLLDLSLALLGLVTRTRTPLLDAERNPLIKCALNATVYDQFCAGRTPEQISNTIRDLKHRGFAGAVLGFAREVVLANEAAGDLGKGVSRGGETARDVAEIRGWRDNQLRTIRMAGRGNIVNIKWTGAGHLTLQRLLKGLDPSPSLAAANQELCETARQEGVALFVDAEQQAIQNTIDTWAVDLMSRWNKPGQPVIVYNTYQAYLRSVPATLSKHLHRAGSEGWVLAVKLVRGAYLSSDPRHLMWATKEETDAAYDGIAEALITGTYNDYVRVPKGSPTGAGSGEEKPVPTMHFPVVHLFLASHNRQSVLKARNLREQQRRSGGRMTKLAFGQLYGMADDVSYALIHGDCEGSEQPQGVAQPASVEAERPMVFKAVIWGTMHDCSEYLLRRGHENRDAASRTADTRRAMAAELRRRCLGSQT
ncbi:proline dehydrogenase [Ascosphaera acerosa]|nr:proline dehydrogenase [Ascosphaera acerosa]